MNKKFELTSETKMFLGKKLYRIRALIDFSTVKKGDLGGFVEKEDNLDHQGDAWVYGNARVSGNARVYGDARVYGNAWVYGDARVSGNAWVYGDARVYGDALEIIWISKVGSENGTLTAFKDKDGNVIVTRGCFIGTIDEFLDAVEKKHGNSRTANEYKLCIELIKSRLLIEKGNQDDEHF